MGGAESGAVDSAAKDSAYLLSRWPTLSDEHLRAILAQIHVFVDRHSDNE
jgi:hypothetical protein